MQQQIVPCRVRAESLPEFADHGVMGRWSQHEELFQALPPYNSITQAVMECC